MLYEEFLKGTGAVDNQASYDEYKRVEAFYMACDAMTKEDVYRMAKVETVAQREAKMKKTRKLEADWVKANLLGASSFIRAASEKEDYFRPFPRYRSECGNLYELRIGWKVNDWIVQYDLFINGKMVENSRISSDECQSYRARWMWMTKEQLEEIFGFIADENILPFDMEVTA